MFNLSLLYLFLNLYITICLCVYSNTWILGGNLSLEKVDIICRKLGFQFHKQVPTGVFVLIRRDVPDSSKKPAEDYTKQLQQEDGVEYAYQEEWKKINQRYFTTSSPDDSYWDDMWYLNDNHTAVSMGVLQAWNLNYTGAGVTIAIVDDGVNYNHVDLKDRIDLDNSHDAYDRDKDPRPVGNARHGTNCAGVALASANKECVIGVAYNSTLIAERILGPLGTKDSATIEAWTNPVVDVSSNSWGASKMFSGPSVREHDALVLGVSNHRDRKGTVYVVAGGNHDVTDDCNMDGYVNSIYTIGVNAVVDDNSAPSYAEHCSAILVSAYSGSNNHSKICTTNPGDRCIKNFDGTSAAAPMVSGAIALLLEANPNLRWRDVQELLIRTSKTSTLQSEDIKTNAVGRNVSDLFGYGLLDVRTLITTAMKWTNLPDQHTCNSDLIYNASVVGDGSTISTTIFTNGCNGTGHCINSVEHVQAQVVFKTSLIGPIEINLKSPSGFVSTLLKTERVDENNYASKNWTYMSVQHWGEDPAGRWDLTIKSNTSDKLQFIGLKLILHGTGDDCSDIEQDQTSTTTEGTNNNETESETNMGQIVVIVCVVLITFIVIFIVLCVLRNRRRRSSFTPSSTYGLTGTIFATRSSSSEYSNTAMSL